MQNTAGTPNYMAPELFLSKPFGNAVDVFAFGVLLNEIWKREVPWDGYSPLDIREKVISGERPPTPRTMPFSCESLVKNMWHATPAMRPSFAEVLPQLESIYGTLPVDHRGLDRSLGRGTGRDALDSLDSLDALSGLSLKPR